MKLRALAILSLGATAALALTSACATGNDPIALTTDPAYVASCQKLGDVNLPTERTYSDKQRELMQLARAKGANTLLVSKNDRTEDSGTAYSCPGPVGAAASH